MLNSSGAEAKAKRLKELIAEQAAKALEAAAIALKADAVLRAPTIDEEYDALMAEDGGSAAVPRAGDRSADQDGRVRLQKPESTYLQNAIANPENLVIEGMRLFFGNYPFLLSQTMYTYVNRHRVGKGHEEIEHEVGPYFDTLEQGGSKDIVPVFARRLRPVDDNKHPGVDQMHKTFASIPHNIFAPLVLKAVAVQALETALAEMTSA